jgi:hypothetical protein
MNNSKNLNYAGIVIASDLTSNIVVSCLLVSFIINILKSGVKTVTLLPDQFSERNPTL